VAPATRLDLPGLLKLLDEREGYSLPFLVAGEPGTPPEALLAAVAAAAAAADAAARAGRPERPVWTTTPDGVAQGVAAELLGGDLSGAEAEEWLAALAAGLDGAGVRTKVVPNPPDRRIPDFFDWLRMPPQPTAFLSLTAGERREVPAETLEAVVRRLADWAWVPRGQSVVRIGLSESVVPPGRVAETALAALPLDPLELGFEQFTTSPRRLRSVRLGLGTRGRLQVVDEQSAPLSGLPALLEALELVAPHLDYACVRRGQAAAGSYVDGPFALRREPTAVETLVDAGAADHLLGSYAVDAAVAQVLTADHLARAADLSGFAVTDVGNDRFLVVAEDPAPWLDDLNPDAGTLAAARAGFGPMLLAEETIRSSPS
jgi:hypothetical protein